MNFLKWNHKEKLTIPKKSYPESSINQETNYDYVELGDVEPWSRETRIGQWSRYKL